MKRSDRVAQLSKPGALELAERETPLPGPGEVLISVEACGYAPTSTAPIPRCNLHASPATKWWGAARPSVPEYRQSGRSVEE